MTRPSPWAVILLACFCSAIGAHAMSVYEKKLELLSTITKQDSLWRHILVEGVVFELDRTYYRDIIDNELLENARCEHKASGAVVGGVGTSGEGEASSSTGSRPDTRDCIVPYEFIRNIMVKRFVIGSIVDKGLEVLKISFKCVLYKHMIHLIKLINVKMVKLSKSQEKDSWLEESTMVIDSILMTMGALQFTDIHLLGTLSFFNIYRMKGESLGADVKRKYAKLLEERSTEMLNYVNNNCALKPKNDMDKIEMEKEVASMIDVYTVKALYSTGGPLNVIKEYGQMIDSIWKKMTSVFGRLSRINGMSMSSWYEILHFQKIAIPNQES